MRKTLFGLLVALGATCAHAGLLYWQVTSDQIDSASSSFGKEGYALNAARVVDDAGTVLAVASYTPATDSFAASDAKVVTAANTLVNGTFTQISYFDYTGSGSSTHSFYIELGNYSSDNTWYGLAVSSSSIATTADVASYVTDGLSLPVTFTAVSAAGFAAPEPSGALLFVLGGALMALRRRRV